MSYVVWFSNPNGPYCALTYLKGVEDSYELKRGVARQDGFPESAHFKMNPDHSERELADSLYNLDRMVVISPRLREFVEQRSPKGVEILGVTIFDHDGEAAHRHYSVLNPLTVIDCIDKERSTLDWNPIDPELICAPEELVFDFDGVDDELPLLCRPRHLPYLVFLRQDLAAAIDDGAFSGIYFAELDEVVSMI